MRNFFSKLKSAFSFQSDRDRYLMGSSDLAELEFRRRQWDRWEMDRARNFSDRSF
ncbi:hypothetical protein D3C87_732980 [compost metagenome]